MGVLKWVDWTVSEPRYFQLQTDHTPIHLALLDEVRRDGHHLHLLMMAFILKHQPCHHTDLHVPPAAAPTGPPAAYQAV